MAISAVAAKFLMAVGKVWEWVKPKLLGRYKVLKAERDAYIGGSDDAAPEILQSFKATYERLLGGVTADSELDRRIAGVERRLTVPAFLRNQSVVAWLSTAAVREALFFLAKATYLGRQADVSWRTRLADSYSGATGERPELSEGIVNAVVEALVGGYRARFEEQSSLIVDSVSATLEGVHEDLTSRLGGMRDQLHAVSQTITEGLGKAAEPLATDEAHRQLTIVLQSRAFDLSTNQRMRELAERARIGDLASASQEVKQKVFLWAARLLSNERSTFADAQGYFAAVDKIPRTTELSIVNAILELNSGHADAAVQVLRDIGTADGRAAMIFALSKSRGFASVVTWYEGLDSSPTAHDISPMGWISLATAFSRLGRWEAAIALLERARPLSRDFPDLLFIEGMYRTAMVVPAEFRDRALDGNLVLVGAPQNEGDEIEKWRTTAIEVLEMAETDVASINQSRAEHARLTRLWLALGSLNDAMRKAAKTELSRLLGDKSQAVRLYPVLRQYSIEFDKEALESYLEVRRDLGGLSDEEWIARFFLALDTLGTQELAPQLLDFLDRHRPELVAVIDARMLTGIRINALLACEGQAARAREELDANRSVFSVDQAAQLEAQIALVEGEDIRPRLEKIYEDAPTIGNLTLLVQHLLQVQDLVALEPRARELYKLERSLPNARLVAACSLHRPNRDPVEIVQFLEAEYDVVARDQELMSEFAWCLLECGDWKKARAVNDKLLSEQPDLERHIDLDTNIAIKSGDWEHFASIFDREWPRRSSHSPRTLLRLAQLANDGRVSADKAFELVRLAAEKGFADVPILVSAYNAALHLGREDELSASWLQYAAATDTSGVVKRVTSREIVEEILPSLQRKNETLLDSFKSSSAPIQLIASFLHMPLARLYCAIPAVNERQSDSRKRFVLPFFGVRVGQPKLSTKAKIAFDVTSILTLTTLGLLVKTLDAFKSAYIAPDTLQLLLKESRHVRFQQPSELDLAHEVLDALRRSILQPVSASTSPPEWLVKEVGQQFALLLESARVSQGYVIAAFPVFRTGSLNEAIANLREYEAHVISCRTYIDSLLLGGKIAHVAYDNAVEKLGRMDSGPKVELATTPDETVFYVDDVAIRYLHRAGVLKLVEQSSLTLQCSPGLEDEHMQVVAEANERDKSVASIDSARLALRRAMECGTVTLLVERPRSERLQALDDGAIAALPTVMAFLRPGHPIDSLAIDDRYFTRLNEIKDEADKSILTYSTLDIIASLVHEGILSSADGAHARHRLRMMGVTYVDINSEELAMLLDLCDAGDSGLLNESHELKIFRQSLVHACALDCGHVRDRQFLESIYGALVETVSKVWESIKVTEARATSVSKWAFDGLGRLLWTAVTSGHVNPRAAAMEMVGLTASGFLLKATAWEHQRRERFHELLDEELLRPAALANLDLFDTIVSQLKLQLEALSTAKTVSDSESRFRTIAIISLLPMRIREKFIDDGEFGDFARASIESVVQFGLSHSIRVDDLCKAAVNTAETGAYESANVRMRLEGETITAELFVDGAWIPVSMPELEGLLKDTSARLEAVQRAIRKLGPTFPDGHRILAAVQDSTLVMEDFELLIRERIRGVRARWARIHERRESPPEADTLAPSTHDYYAALLGPVATSSTFSEYVSETLLPYRARLIELDLNEGLRIACLGFFDESLAPSQLVRDVGDEELWNAVQSLGDLRDPFSLLGVIEVALGRVKDSRFAELVAKYVEQLCSEEMMKSPAFVAAGLLAKLSLSQIQTLDNASMMQPYWKRMAAWMQAGVVMQSYGEFRFHLPALETWVEQNLQPTHVAAEVMDLHVEPLVAASWTTGEAFWDNTFRLLVGITTAKKQSGQTVLHADKVRELVEKRLSSAFASFYSTGPCQSLKNRGSAKVTDADVAFAQEKLAAAPLSHVWLGLKMAAQVASVPREAYEVGLNGLRSITLHVSDVDWDEKLAGATEAALFGLTEGDSELAVALRDFLVRVAHTATSQERVLSILRTLFVAAGAFREPDERAAWIADATKMISLAIPAGPAAFAAAETLRVCSDLRKWHLGPASWAELYARSCS